LHSGVCMWPSIIAFYATGVGAGQWLGERMCRADVPNVPSGC
jgi:hypothetical protein